MEILNKGVDYIKAGLSIHLLKPLQKAPIHNAWSSIPNLNSKELYEEFKECPDANIGVRLGEFSKIGEYFLYVLDLDISSEKAEHILEAHETMKEVYSNYLELPTMKSASKNSRHFYFLSKKVLKNKKLAKSKESVEKEINGEIKKKSAWEIDLMSTGRQVVIAPSVFNGNTYTWEKDLLEYLADESKKSIMILDTINILSEEEKKDYNQSEPEPIKLIDIQEVLDSLDQSEWLDDYANWIKIGMALHHEYSDTENEQEAFNLYENWSKKGQTYQKGETWKKWKSFSKKDDGITIATLLQNKIKVSKSSKIERFSKFLNENKLDLDNLKKAINDFELTDIELEFFIQDISNALSLTFNKKFLNPQTRKVLAAFKKEARKEAYDLEAKLDIGLDDTLARLVLKNKFDDGKFLVAYSKHIFYYKKGCWRAMELDTISNIAYNEISAIINSNNKDYDVVKKAIFKKKKNDDMNGLTNQIVNTIIKIVSSSPDDDILNLQRKKDFRYSVINTLNKEIYIEDGKITVQDHKYDSYLITQMNVDYDPNAECPTFMKVLNNVFQEHADKDEVIRHFLECWGLAIQSKKNIHQFIMMIGGGENGKTFIKDCLLKALSIDSVLSTSITKFNQSAHSEAGLVAKLVLVDDDFKKGDILDDGFIKKTSQTSLMTGNPKFKGPITFWNNCTSVILSNYNPKTRDVSHGLSRRAQVFPFNHIFSDAEKDSTLEDKISLELSGILNVLIKHYIQLQNRGFFKVPMTCQQAQRKWINSSNPLQAFLDDKIIVTGDDNDTYQAQRLYELYKNYTRNENEGMQMSRASFYGDLATIKGLKMIVDTHDKMMYIHGMKINIK